jgi:hypothetical protein
MGLLDAFGSSSFWTEDVPNSAKGLLSFKPDTRNVLARVLMEYAKDTPNRVRENIATNFPDPNLLTPQGMKTPQGQQARNALADVMMGVAGTTKPIKAAGGLLGDLNQFRQVDMFGNGSRMQYFDDAKNLYYESQKYPSGRVGWKAGEVVDGNTNWLSDKEFSSMAEAAASVRGQRISNSLNERNASLYGDIPKLWDADAKKVAKGLIDAGVPIERFSQSTQSPSKYIYLQDGRKVRVSNHNLPLGYEQPDYNFVSGENVANFVKKITAP